MLVWVSSRTHTEQPDPVWETRIKPTLNRQRQDLVQGLVLILLKTLKMTTWITLSLQSRGNIPMEAAVNLAIDLKDRSIR